MTLCLPELPARINAPLNFVAILLGPKSLERKSTIRGSVHTIHRPAIPLSLCSYRPSYRELSWGGSSRAWGRGRRGMPHRPWMMNDPWKKSHDTGTLEYIIANLTLCTIPLFPKQQYGSSWFGRWILGWNWIVAKWMTRFGGLVIFIHSMAAVIWGLQNYREVNYTPTSKTVKTLFTQTNG